MTLIEKARQWLKDEEFDRIIDADLEIPEEDHSFEFDEVLVAALARTADPDTEEGKERLKRILALAENHEEELLNSSNFCRFVGYAHYALCNYGQSLPLFERALTLLREEGASEARIDNVLEMGRYSVDEMMSPTLASGVDTFKARAAAVWEVFSEREADWRKTIMGSDNLAEDGLALIDEIHEVLSELLPFCAFEVGKNEEAGRPEIIFSAEGNVVLLMAARAFVQNAPDTIKRNWLLTLGRPALPPSFALKVAELGIDLTREEVRVTIDAPQAPLENARVNLVLHHPQLAALAEMNAGAADWVAEILLNQTLGEIACMRLIGELAVADEPASLGAEDCTLATLGQALSQLGIDVQALSAVSEDQRDPYVVNTDGEVSERADYRLDIVEGESSALLLHLDYLYDEPVLMDMLRASGIVAGFLVWDIKGLNEEEALALEAHISAALHERLDESVFTEVGCARGLYTGYLDVIVWDYTTFLEALDAVYNELALKVSGFHTFYRRCPTLYTTYTENEE